MSYSKISSIILYVVGALSLIAILFRHTGKIVYIIDITFLIDIFVKFRGSSSRKQ